MEFRNPVDDGTHCRRSTPDSDRILVTGEHDKHVECV